VSKASKNNEARSLARRLVRVMDVEDGQVLVIKRTEESQNLELFNGLSKALGSSGRQNCIVVSVREFDDISKLNDDEMKELGWQRVVKDEQ